MNTSSESGAKSRSVTMEAMVGLFVAVVFLGLAVFTIVISGSALFRKNQFPIEVVMPDAMGIRANDPVIARGTTVGAVDDVFYDRDGVHVKAMLKAPVVFREGYKITVVSTSILGGRQLVLEEGADGAPEVKDLMRLKGEKPADLFDDATKIVNHVSEGEGPLGKIIYDEAMASNLVETIANLRQVSADISNMTARIQTGEGLLGRAFYDDRLGEDVSAAVADIRSIAADISNMTAKARSGEGVLGKLVYDDELAGRLTNIVASVEAASFDISNITARATSGEGLLGRLIYDDELGYKLTNIVANLETVSARLGNGEGTLGKLLSEDDEMYRNLNGLLLDGRELIDDFREASPVSTFSSFVFGAF